MIDQTLSLPKPDYEADDVLLVTEPEQLRALGDDLRAKIIVRLRHQAASTTELAEELGLPKGTVGHHLKVLERAGLIRVVRTRQVRAVTEKYYGRVARLFIFKGTDAGMESAAAAAVRSAADELAAGGELLGFAAIHMHLDEKDARRFARKLEKVVDEFRSREQPDGERYGFVAGLYVSKDPA